MSVRPDGQAAEPALSFRAGQITLRIDLRLYRLSAIQKTAYRLARQSTVVFGEMSGDSIDIALMFEPSTTEQEACRIARLFFQELLDQELREKVREETASLRALLLAHAFSRTGLR